MDEIDLIITDSNISDKISQRIEEFGIELMVVDVNASPIPYSGKRGATGTDNA